MRVDDREVDIVLVVIAARVFKDVVASGSVQFAELRVWLYRHDVPAQVAIASADGQVVRLRGSDLDEHARGLVREETCADLPVYVALRSRHDLLFLHTALLSFDDRKDPPGPAEA